MARDDSFKDFVLEQLHDLPGVTARAMFGGHGLYKGGTFFGVIHGGRLFFKTDEASRAEYVERGMGYFQPNAKQALKAYYEVPDDVLESPPLLVEWAQRATKA